MNHELCSPDLTRPEYAKGKFNDWVVCSRYKNKEWRECRTQLFSSQCAWISLGYDGQLSEVQAWTLTKILYGLMKMNTSFSAIFVCFEKINKSKLRHVVLPKTILDSHVFSLKKITKKKNTKKIFHLTFIDSQFLLRRWERNAATKKNDTSFNL